MKSNEDNAREAMNRYGNEHVARRAMTQYLKLIGRSRKELGLRGGWVYVLSNRAMPGLVKIGYSDCSPEERARELCTAGVPEPFVVEFCQFVEDPSGLESRVHSRLASARCRDIREFFRCSVRQAVNAVRDSI
jgi:T5orf172 domain-containing protein